MTRERRIIQALLESEKMELLDFQEDAEEVVRKVLERTKEGA